MSQDHLSSAWNEACRLWASNDQPRKLTLEDSLQRVVSVFDILLRRDGNLDDNLPLVAKNLAGSSGESSQPAQPFIKQALDVLQEKGGSELPHPDSTLKLPKNVGDTPNEPLPSAEPPPGPRISLSVSHEVESKRSSEVAEAVKEASQIPHTSALKPPSAEKVPSESLQQLSDKPVSRAGPIPAAVPVSIFKVDLKRETAGNFFTRLRFRRNDPASDPVLQDLLEHAEVKKPSITTARQLFAYSIPWSERGGKPPELPAVAPTFDHLPALDSFTKFGELATKNALQTASRLKRQSQYLQSYTSSKEEIHSASEYFQSIDWSSAKRPLAPQSI